MTPQIPMSRPAMVPPTALTAVRFTPGAIPRSSNGVLTYLTRAPTGDTSRTSRTSCPWPLWIGRNRSGK